MNRLNNIYGGFVPKQVVLLLGRKGDAEWPLVKDFETLSTNNAVVILVHLMASAILTVV